MSSEPTDSSAPKPSTNTYTLVAKIKPGELESLRAAAKAAETGGMWGVGSETLGILHFMRFFIIDDEYLVFTSDFDGDDDSYLSDFYSMEITPGPSLGLFNSAWKYTEGWPGPGDKDAFIDFWKRNKVEELLTYSYYPGAAAKEVRKGLRVQQAFQAVLDDPDAAAALQHPALKPLLDEASD